VALRYLDTAIGFAVVMLLLSLLVTTFVQTVVAIFNLRGTNLQWGLKILLGQIDPTLPEKIRNEIAERVLTHPAVASTRFPFGRRRAVAIRVEELYRVFRQLGEANAVAGGKPLTAEAFTALNRLVGEPLLDAARVDQLATDIGSVAPEKAAVLRAWMTEALGKSAKIVAGVSDWFDTIMDRTSQRFAMYTRWFSVLAAVLLTLLLRLDTPGVLNRIWSSGALRDQLVAAAPEALRVADTVRTYELSQQTLATRAIRSIREEHADTALQTILAGAPGELGSVKEGADWLTRALAGRRDSAAVLDAYRRRMARESDSLLARFADASKKVRGVLADPAVGIFQAPLPPFGRYWSDWDHIIRGLISVVLLSLGAPFWYNALKRTANLRPALAAKVAEEAKPKEG
jgi:hypothetical protein